jgi:hypothetical protein
VSCDVSMGRRARPDLPIQSHGHMKKISLRQEESDMTVLIGRTWSHGSSKPSYVFLRRILTFWPGNHLTSLFYLGCHGNTGLKWGDL